MSLPQHNPKYHCLLELIRGAYIGTRPILMLFKKKKKSFSFFHILSFNTHLQLIFAKFLWINLNIKIHLHFFIFCVFYLYLYILQKIVQNFNIGHNNKINFAINVKLVLTLINSDVSWRRCNSDRKKNSHWAHDRFGSWSHVLILRLPQREHMKNCTRGRANQTLLHHCV